jgi:hypothetical protein
MKRTLNNYLQKWIGVINKLGILQQNIKPNDSTLYNHTKVGDNYNNRKDI